jgi:YVTN family beta-propeller protein
MTGRWTRGEPRNRLLAANASSGEGVIAIPTEFGPYTLNWLIGRGGMGEVHNAFDSRHNRYVALKLLSHEVSEDEDLCARFRREAQIVASLRHPHVIPVHGFGEIEGRMYLDMRLVEGSDLATMLEGGALPPERAVDIVEQVAGALEAAHDEGLVHRDVKPSNVLIARGGGSADFAYLVDFGIARSVDAPTVTREDQPAGTLAYMAPERFRGARPAASGDIYALACLLYECLTGRRPFENANLPDLLYAHLDEPPPRPSASVPTLAAFDAVIARGLAKDPSDRYRTATELASAARDAVDHGPGRPRVGRLRRWGALNGRPSRGALASIVAVSLVAITAGVAATLRGGEGSGAMVTSVGENSVGVLDPATGRLSRSIAVDSGPGAVVAGFGAIWTANTIADTVSRIDPATGSVTRIVVQSAPSAIAIGAGSVWVTNGASGTVSRIDPATDRTRSIAVGTAPGGVAVAAGAVWVSNTGDATVSRIDPAQNDVVRTIPVGAGPGAIGGGHGIWVANSTSNTVSRIDPNTNTIVQTIPVGHDPEGIDVVGDDVWVANNLDGTISRIATTGRSVTATVALGTGSQPTAFTEAGGMLWVVSTTDDAVYEVDVGKSAARIVRRVPLGVVPAGVTTAEKDGAVWVTGAIDPARHRGGTIRIRGEDPGSVDPSFGGTKVTSGLLNGSYDGLVGVRHAPGAKGIEIVPDLATALPASTDGGRSYVFRLRTGIRWSDGSPLTVFDVRRGFERAILSGLPSVQNEIVGASSCSVAKCDIRGIDVDPMARTVTIHLVRPNAAFLDQIATFCPAVPASTPLAEQKGAPVPATGPYRISTYVAGKSIILTRNPYFEQWSAAAQPAGFPDGLDYEIAPGGSPISGAEAKAEVADVGAGRDDWADARFAGTEAELAAKFGDRLHLSADGSTRGVALNTRIPPFNDVRVRRALNFAVDRAAAAAAGPSIVKPTCQVLPPDFPGYRPYCPYTLHPNSRGSWDSPDFVTAERLVAASHTKGMEVTVWSLPHPAPGVEAVVRALRDLGYRVNFKVGNAGGDYFAYVADSRHQVQASFFGWISDDPSVEDFIPRLFACGSFSAGNPQNPNTPGFCDAGIDALIRHAEQVESMSPHAANDVWALADKRITDASPWVSLVNASWVDAVSHRVHNYVRNPVIGVLFDQMWVV